MALTTAERSARYWARHPERCAERNRRNAKRYARENPEVIRARAQRRRDENPEYHREHSRLSARRRRIAKRGSTDLSAAAEYDTLLRRDPCSYCGGKQPVEPVVDHIDAVAAGGTGDWDNLTAACRRCNARKHVKPLLMFMLTEVSNG